MTRRAAVVLAGAFALTLTGCGPGYKLTPTSGVLKIGGKPEANILVQFYPQGGTGPTSFGVTDEQGRFTLKTTDGRDGAMIGPHKVVLVDQDEERPAQGQAPKRKPRLSDQYAIATKGLDVEVKEGGGPIELSVPGVK